MVKRWAHEPVRILSKTQFSPSHQLKFHVATWLVPSNYPNHPKPPHPLIFVQLYFSFGQVLIRHAAKLDRDQNWISPDSCFTTARVQAAVQILSNFQESLSRCQCHPFFSFLFHIRKISNAWLSTGFYRSARSLDNLFRKVALQLCPAQRSASAVGSVADSL